MTGATWGCQTSATGQSYNKSKVATFPGSPAPADGASGGWGWLFAFENIKCLYPTNLCRLQCWLKNSTVEFRQIYGNKTARNQSILRNMTDLIVILNLVLLNTTQYYTCCDMNITQYYIQINSILLNITVVLSNILFNITQYYI